MEEVVFRSGDRRALNADFVSIKVDRERPDIDLSGMRHLLAAGGWPLSVSTPDLRPFYIGTYFLRKTLRQTGVSSSAISN